MTPQDNENEMFMNETYYQIRVLMTAKQNTVLLKLLATGDELFGGPIIAELRLSNNKKHIRTESTLENARQCLGYVANHRLRTILQTQQCPATARA